MMNLCMPLLKGESAADKIGPTYPFLRVRHLYPPRNYYPNMVLNFVHNMVRINNYEVDHDITIYDENGKIIKNVYMPPCVWCREMYSREAIAPTDCVALLDLSPLVNIDNVVIPVKYPSTPSRPINWDFYVNYFRFGPENDAHDQCSIAFMTSCIDGRPNATKSELVALLNQHMGIFAQKWGNVFFKNINDYAFFTESNTIEPNLYSGAILITQHGQPLADRYYRFYSEDEPYIKPGYTIFNKVIALTYSQWPPLLTAPYSDPSAYNPKYCDMDDLLLYLSLLKEGCIDDALRKLNTERFSQ